MLKSFKFRPGYFRDSTNYSNEGGWNDGDKVRFRAEYPEKIGGWKKETQNTFLGTCRSLNRWYSNAGDRYIGLGTSSKFYIYWGGTFYDVTPIRRSVTLSANKLTTIAAGGGLIEVEDAGHGAVAGDYVTISGATGFDGIAAGDINKEHVVASVTSSAKYNIATAGVATAGSVSGGGAAIACAYQISVGYVDYSAGSGYGASPWSSGGWGSPSDLSVSGSQIRVWTQANFGEDLIACPLNGALYYWDETTGTSARMVALSSMSGASDVPAVALMVGMSPLDRHVIAFGASDIGGSVYDPLLVRWSNQEDAANWTPDTTTTAGSYRLSLGSSIISTIQTKQERLIWTDSALYTMRFSGAPYTFGFEVASGHTSIASPNASVQFNDRVFWMGDGNFYVYSGSVEFIPCTVRDFVFGNINFDQRYKIFSGTVTKFGEVWWFYPSADSTEVDRYVAYSITENAWHYGSIERTAWLENAGDVYPYSVGGGNLYIHEYGDDADGSPMPAYIESSDFDIEDGTKFMFVKRLMPDIEFRGEAPQTDQSVTCTLAMRRSPGVDSIVSSVVAQMGKETYKNIRSRGRQASIRVESNLSGTGWRMGMFRLDIREDGRR